MGKTISSMMVMPGLRQGAQVGALGYFFGLCSERLAESVLAGGCGVPRSASAIARRFMVGPTLRVVLLQTSRVGFDRTACFTPLLRFPQ